VASGETRLSSAISLPGANPDTPTGRSRLAAPRAPRGGQGREPPGARVKNERTCMGIRTSASGRTRPVAGRAPGARSHGRRSHVPAARVAHDLLDELRRRVVLVLSSKCLAKARASASARTSRRQDCRRLFLRLGRSCAEVEATGAGGLYMRP
jgi:hypothetical protein